MHQRSRRRTAGEVWAHARARPVIALLIAIYGALAVARDEWPAWFDDKVPWVATPLAWTTDRLPPWLILVGGFAIALWATFEWAHQTVWDLRERQPHLEFETDWYRETPVRRQVDVNAWQSAGVGRFQGVRLTNKPRSRQRAQTAHKVHARVWFYGAAGEVQMELSTARWTKNPEGWQAPELAIEAVDMIPGSPCDLDLLVRFDDNPTAHGWTNTGAVQSGNLPPGDYRASVHLNSEDFIDEQVYVFAVSVPNDASDRIAIELEADPDTTGGRP